MAKEKFVANKQQEDQHYFEPGEILVAPGHTYLVIGLLGEGGMGAVYEGIDRDTGQEVAIKVLRYEHAHGGDIHQRFARESRIPGQIGKRKRGATKYLLKVTAIGELQPRGTPYYAMTRLSGCTVQELMASSAARQRRLGLWPGLPVDVAVNTVIGLMLSVEALHQCGVVHRDIKPANIFLHKAPAEPDAVILLDYGIAHLMDEGSRTAIAGSQGYIAPEHFTGEIGPPADIFAVGVMLFSMLAGVKPASLLNSAWPVPRETRSAPSLAEFGMVPAVVELVARCLALDPRARPTASELYEKLQEISLALPEVDVATAATEDDPVDRTPAGENSTGISIAECSPATTPDLELTPRMNALRVANERRAALGLPALTHLSNNATTPMAGRPSMPVAGAQTIPVASGRRQATVPMGRSHESPVLRPVPMTIAAGYHVTVPPGSSSPSPLAFGPVSVPEYAPESEIDPIVARLPDRSRLEEALKQAVRARDGNDSGDNSAARFASGVSASASARDSSVTSVAGLARSPGAEPRRFAWLVAALRERRRRSAILARERLTERAARLEGQRLAKELATQERSERELAEKQRYVERNRRLRREAEAHGEPLTDHGSRSSWPLRLSVCALLMGLGIGSGVLLRKNPFRSAPSPLEASPVTLVSSAAKSGREVAAEAAANPSPVVSASASAASVRALASGAKPPASPARALAPLPTVIKPPQDSSDKRPVPVSFE